MKKLLLLYCFITICSSLKAMDAIPLKQILEKKDWNTLIDRMLKDTVTPQELYAYDRSLFEGVNSQNWPLNELLAHFICQTLEEKNDGHGRFSYTHTTYSLKYLNIIEQLITMDKIRMPEHLTDTLANNGSSEALAIASTNIFRRIVNQVKLHLDMINMSINSQSWAKVATYMNHQSLPSAYVMHLTPEQNQKLITELKALTVNPSNPTQSEYINKICAELPQPTDHAPQPPLGSHAPHNENKTFFNTVTQKCLGLATLCIIVGIVTYKYYTSSSENEDTDEKKQEQISPA